MLTIPEIDFLKSLPDLELELVLAELPKEEAALILALLSKPPAIDEREAQRQTMSRKRAIARDIRIPVLREGNRRLDCMVDAELFLTTYFPDVFFEPFTADRRAMVRSIVDAARFGGDQAIAGPRGEGKTRLAIYTALYLMVTGLSPFPTVIGKSQSKAQGELKTLKEKLQQSTAFRDDFPEIGIPFQAVGGWSSRARMQTVSGTLTNIEIGADHLIFPSLGWGELPNEWPCNCPPVSNGQIIASVGIDGPVRGMTYRDKRPTIAIIDDIEDREAATSETLIEKNEEIIEQDIAGLGQSSQRVSRVMLCTIQNRKCIAYKYTDPKQKPSWKGRRYRKMLKRPDRMDLVQTYISKRQERTDNDPDAREAFRFWRDNKAELEDGCIVSNVQSYDQRLHADGEPLELSAIHSYFNRVADVGEKAVATEIDNDPPEDVGPTGIGLTAKLVASRLNGLERRQLPANTIAVTAAIDLGKYRCHWVIIAWWNGAGGAVVDYGIAEVSGTDKTIDNEASEPQIYKALLGWRDELLQKNFVDAAGVNRQIDFALVDSGTFTNAAYEFVRQVGGVFHVSKGMNPYRAKKQSAAGILAGNNLHAVKLASQNVWLYELDTSYWKQWTHERFLTPTFDESNMLRRGSLSLFNSDTDRHKSFAHHICAEELVTEFKEGKGSKTYWRVQNENNHWLDAAYMAAAASEACGVKLVAPPEESIQPKHVKANEANETKKPKTTQHGQPRFRTRPGGWIPKRRNG